MANIITSAATEESSSEFTLTDGQTANIYLTSTYPRDARAIVYVKSAAGTFTPVGELSSQYPAKVLAGAGTYKVTRMAPASGTSFGVEKN